ncbi:MAG TPA: fatty acid desaturase [Acetobacteraceae bacterium]|jgi:fatty acid desaturase|nr:fatty acid desaturase [Acetobacteraceae bacterium]
MSGQSDRVLSTQELRALQARSDLRGGTRLAIHLALLVGAGWLVALSSGWVILPAVFLLGLVQVALFAPAHETMHQTAFASRKANAIVGWLTSCPSLLNWHFYTPYHLAHHRHTQVPGLDPELMAPAPASPGGYVLRVLGVPFWILRLRVIRDCWFGDLSGYPFIAGTAAPKIVRSVRAMTVVMLGGAMGAALLFGWATPFVYWIGPQLLGQPPLRAYLLAEHTGCTLDRNGLTNTRTTLTSAPVRWLMWDMPYHAEHHLFPSIPFHRLAAAHALIGSRLGFVQPGYVRWNWAFVRSLMRN